MHPLIYDCYQLCKIIPGTIDTHASAFLLTLKLRIQRSLLKVFHAGVWRRILTCPFTCLLLPENGKRLLLWHIFVLVNIYDGKVILAMLLDYVFFYGLHHHLNGNAAMRLEDFILLLWPEILPRQRCEAQNVCVSSFCSCYCPRRVLAQRPKPEEAPWGPPRVRVYIQGKSRK